MNKVVVFMMSFFAMLMTIDEKIYIPMVFFVVIIGTIGGNNAKNT